MSGLDQEFLIFVGVLVSLLVILGASLYVVYLDIR